MEIESKYKTTLRGVYNKAVDICPYCGSRMNGKLFKNCKGIADSDYGQMMIIECDTCWETFYFHCGELYEYFLDTIDDGTNIHFTH